MTRVVFFQGIGASMYQLLRARVLFSEEEAPLPDKDLPEVIHTWSLNPIHLIAMLFTKILFWFRGVSYTPCHAIRYGLCNIAQSEDIFHHQQRMKAVDEKAKEDLICYGVSRGALVTFISIALNGHPPSLKLVVLEGSPDSIPNVLEARYRRFFGAIVEDILCTFTKYTRKDARTYSGLKLAANFPKDVPVALVTSEKDTVVPMANTLALANALKASGHTKVHLLCLKHASHDSYLTGHPDDRKDYIEFITNLRKLYEC